MNGCRHRVPEKHQAPANTKNTVAERIADLSAELDSQLKQKVKFFFPHFQLAIFVRGADANLNITDEFLELVP